MLDALPRRARVVPLLLAVLLLLAVTVVVVGCGKPADKWEGTWSEPMNSEHAWEVTKVDGGYRVRPLGFSWQPAEMASKPDGSLQGFWVPLQGMDSASLTMVMNASGTIALTVANGPAGQVTDSTAWVPEDGTSDLQKVGAEP
jgi:hypothetical protein